MIRRIHPRSRRAERQWQRSCGFVADGIWDRTDGELVCDGEVLECAGDVAVAGGGAALCEHALTGLEFGDR
jgi:hypothetical protein